MTIYFDIVIFAAEYEQSLEESGDGIEGDGEERDWKERGR